MSSKKLSLVVLRSWNDDPPKIKGIAPPDDDRSVKFEPDLKGQFLAEEITDPEHDPRFTPRGRTFSAGAKERKEKLAKDEVYNHHEVSGNGWSPEPSFMRGQHQNQNGYREKHSANRHSYGGFGDSEPRNGISPSPTGEERSPFVRTHSNLHVSPGKVPHPESLSFRPSSAGTNSPDNHDGSSMEYTPPSSPVSGRYRNLGPELAATIPKRIVKSSWITGIKSRWIRSTTHPESGRSTLKSYSSSPSLVAIASSEPTPFFNPLYKLVQKRVSVSGSTGSSGVVLTTDEDTHSDRSRSSLSNPLTYSPSPPPNSGASLRQQIVHNSCKPNGLQKYGSLTDFSEEELLFGSVTSVSPTPTGSPYYGLSSSGYEESHPDVDECVLVEVIRKSETPSGNENNGKGTGSCVKKGAKNEKRHSVELEQVVGKKKFEGVNVEGSPGKVARIKENIKKFGRFGKNHSEKILRFRAGDTVTNLDTAKQTIAVEDITKSESEKHENEKEEESLKSHDETPIPLPTARKRSKNLDVTPDGSLLPIAPAITQSNEDSGDGIDPLSHLNQEKGSLKPQIIGSPPTTLPRKNKRQAKNSEEVEQSNQPVDLGSRGQNHRGIFKNDFDGCNPTHNISIRDDYSQDLLGERAPMSSLISDQEDRSMSSQEHSVPTIDVETFIVHSGEPGRVSDIVTSVGSTEPKNSDNNEISAGDNDHFHINVNCMTPEDIQAKGEGLLAISAHKDFQEDEMFRSRGQFHLGRDKTGAGSVDVKAVVNKFSNAEKISEDLKIVHGKFNNLSSPNNANGIAAVEVPVQAINRHVMANKAYDVKSSYANSVEDDHGSPSQSPGSASSESRSTDFEWHRSSSRTSFRGFCEGLLQNEGETLSIRVPEVVEASISFDEDSSSLEPADEETENGLDYISVADVKLRHPLKSERRHSRDNKHLPGCVVSLDIGSRGSGYSYWVKEENDCVRIGKVDSGSLCPKSHKMPSWVSFDDIYLDTDEDDDNESSTCSPSFGHPAFNRFMTENSQAHFYWKWREQFNEGSTFPYTLESKANDGELLLIMKSAIKHYAKIALDQAAAKKPGNSVESVVLAIAVPANFDRHARELVRDAAFRSGVVSRKDGLVLIEDPYAAGVFAYHAIKSKLSKMSSIDTSFLSVDIGGVFLHSSGYEFQDGKLHQTLIPTSQPIQDRPESLFEAELSGIFTPSFLLNYQTKYKAGWLKIMTEFDLCKNLFDPTERGNYHIFLPSSFVDHFRRFTSMEVEDALESSDILWSRVGAFGIPYWKMQRYIQPMMEFVKNYILNIVKTRSYEFLVLTGGRSGSRQFVEHVKNAVRDFSVDVVVPKEYNAAVLQGCTISLTNLAPRMILKAPFSIGIGVMKIFLEKFHPEEKRVLRDGKSFCADIFDTLIAVGSDLEVNQVIKRSYVGAQPGQSLLILPVFQSPEEPKFVTEASVRKCCEFKFNSGQKAWQEVQLVIKCRPSELLIMAIDDGIMKDAVVLDLNCNS